MIKKINKKQVVIIISIILFFSFIISSISYLINISKNKNIFIIGNIRPEIIEIFDDNNNIKRDVYVKNNGNSDIYVRAFVIYNFEDKNNRVLSDKPIKDIDYKVSFSDSDNWILNDDGFYYYKKILKSGKNTDNLIDEIILLSKRDDKKFIADIIVQALQAYPSSSVSEAWGIAVVNEELSLE